MRNAYRVYLIFSASSAFLFQLVFTTSMLYFVTVAHLDPLQLILVGTALEAAIFIFEIPTGIVADLYSRRLSIIIGLLLIGVGFLVEGAFPVFLSLLVSQVLWGIGYTFTSGATQAWISDEIGEENAGSAFVRGTQLEQLGALAGILPGIILGNLSIPLPILVGGGLFILLGLSLIWFMPENGFRPTPQEQRTTFQHMLATFRQGIGMVRIRPALVGILAVGLLLGVYSEGYDRLWTAHLLERFTLPNWAGMTNVTWFGLLSAAGMLLTAGAAEFLQRRVNLRSMRNITRGMSICAALLVICLFLFPAVWSLGAALVLLLLISILRRVIDPLYTAWVNHRLDSSVRATVISMSSQMDALGQIGGGPLVGLVARQFDLAAGLFTSAGLLTPILLILGWQLRDPESKES